MSDSFLSGQIKPIIQFARKCNSKLVSEGMHKLKQCLEGNLSQLKKTEDLRVFDGNNGGCIRGPKKSRKKSQSGFDLLCNRRYMKHGKNNKPSEVPYMRALFNENNICNYKIISYETPFLRKKHGNINPAISGRSVSCDLLGLNNNELCCIEVKTVPDKSATFLPYGLLEGFAYAVCLKWINDNCPDDLLKEINLCCNDFGINQNFYAESSTVKFAIAGPQEDYFNPYITKKKTGDRQKRAYFVKTIDQAKCIEEELNLNYPDWFKGYILLSYSVDDCKENNKIGDLVRPYFNKIQNACTIIPSVTNF